MSMDYNDFLECVINDGIEAAKRDYRDRAAMLKGAVDGFEACRGLQPHELSELLAKSHKRTEAALWLLNVDESVRPSDSPRPSPDEYWEIRCFEAEVEWVCNCVSAALLNRGVPTIIHPTARGWLKAAAILGMD